MKRFIVIQLVSLLLAVIFFTSSAMAIGLGFYLNPGIFGGEADWTLESTGYKPSDYTQDTEHTGFGFVLDTAVAKNSLFNYRLNLGMEEFTSEGGANTAEYELDSFVIDNTFGFAVFKNKLVRIWLGPQIRVSISDGEIKDFEDFDISLFGFGIGPVFGANFNLGKVFTPAVTIGCRYTSYFGTGESKISSYECDYTITETTLFFNVALLFRMGDMY